MTFLLASVETRSYAAPVLETTPIQLLDRRKGTHLSLSLKISSTKGTHLPLLKKSIELIINLQRVLNSRGCHYHNINNNDDGGGKDSPAAHNINNDDGNISNEILQLASTYKQGLWNPLLALHDCLSVWHV